METNFTFPYINYKGKFSIREASPACVGFKFNNKYHGDAWIMKAVDKKKGEFRDFNLADILRGVIMHTLLETKGDCTIQEVDEIFNKIK